MSSAHKLVCCKNSSHHLSYMINIFLFVFSDSDEKDFEDDPLLQVLRKQRTWIREQIR